MPSRASVPLETLATPETNIAPVAAPKARTKLAAAAAAPAQDTLAQELLLLTSATSQLSARQATGALLALEEHQRRFSHGVLSNERNVAKARALCMLHRFEEGRATLALLGGTTPAAARVKRNATQPGRERIASKPRPTISRFAQRQSHCWAAEAASHSCLARPAAGDCGASWASSARPSLTRFKLQSACALRARRSTTSMPLGNFR